MFNGKYLDWNQKRIKGILDFYGHKFMYSKKVLDLGCGHADISGVFYRLGADITVVDARQEHLKIANKKYSGIKTIKADLDRGWPFHGKLFDLILDLDLLCHLSEYEAHLKNVCLSTNHLVLETAVCDSNDPYKFLVLPENKSVYDLSINGVSCRPSGAAIERILIECGMSFKRQDNARYNSDSYCYDWEEKNNQECNINKRRLWFAVKQSSKEISISNNSPFILKNSFVPISMKNTTANNKIIHNVKPIKITSNDNLKVALCLSGHLRTFENTSPSIVKNLINPTKADVFIHTWDSLGFDPGRGDADSINLKTQDYLDKINNIFSPKNIVVEKFFPQNKDKYKERIIETRDPSNILGMFYKIKKCNEIKQNYEEENGFLYDVVIRCRPDLNIDKIINVNDFVNMDSIFLPIFDFHLGYNDKFAFGSSKAMDIYSLCFDYIPSYYDKGCIFNAEAIMKFHINYFSIPIKRCDIEYSIIRMDGFKFSNT